MRVVENFAETLWGIVDQNIYILHAVFLSCLFWATKQIQGQDGHVTACLYIFSYYPTNAIYYNYYVT